MRPFDNKSKYDPGRMRYGIKFYTQQSVPDGYGGEVVSDVLSHETRCAQLQLSSYDQLSISAGASLLSKDRYFVIRKRPNWQPQKDMTVEVSNEKYTIRAIIDLDQPQHYWKLLCSWQA